MCIVPGCVKSKLKGDSCQIDACPTENTSPVLWILPEQFIRSFIFYAAYRCNHSRPTRG
jgi:hypothetical protein